MTGRYFTETADVLRAAGVQVVEVDGWKTRARSSGGFAAGRPWCVMWHHTASKATPESDVSYIVNADTAPISNLLIARDGCAWVVAAGATNTNGKGGPLTLPKGTVPANCMNEYGFGMEIANDGVGEPYPQAQIDCAFACSNALNLLFGNPPTAAVSHASWSPGRKIDPAVAWAVQGPWEPRSINSSGTWNLDDLRAECQRRATPAPIPTPDPEEDDVPFIIVNKDTGQPALVYDGKVTGLDGGSLATFVARYGQPITVESVTFDDFAAKGG